MLFMKFLFFTALLFLLVSGCVTVEYRHTVALDGSGTLTQLIDFTRYAEFVNTSTFNESVISSFCTSMQDRLTSGTTCAVEGNTVVLSRQVDPNGGFYSFESSGDLFNPRAKLTVHRIPSTSFLVSTGIDNVPVEDIDLNDRERNAAAAASLRIVGANVTYAITMPFTVTSARAGNYTAIKNGNTATFDLLAVLSASEPLVVQAGVFNILPVLGGILVIAMVALLVWLFFGKSNRK